MSGPLRAPHLTGVARWDAFNRVSAMICAEAPLEPRGLAICVVCGKAVGQHDAAQTTAPYSRCPDRLIKTFHTDCYASWWSAVKAETWARLEAEHQAVAA